MTVAVSTPIGRLGQGEGHAPRSPAALPASQHVLPSDRAHPAFRPWRRSKPSGGIHRPVSKVVRPRVRREKGGGSSRNATLNGLIVGKAFPENHHGATPAGR